MFLFEPILPRGQMIIKRHGRGDPGSRPLSSYKNRSYKIRSYYTGFPAPKSIFFTSLCERELRKRGTPLKPKQSPKALRKN